MLTIHRWPNVPLECWPNVGPTRWPNVGPTWWRQHVVPLTLALRRTNTLALRRADEQNYIGPFYDVGLTCTYNHGQTLAQHRAYTLSYCWANMMALRRTNMLALRRADEQNCIGPTPFLWCWANVHVQPWARNVLKFIAKSLGPGRHTCWYRYNKKILQLSVRLLLGRAR